MNKVVFAVLLLALAGLLGWKIHSRIQAQAAAAADSGRGGKPAVPVEVGPVQRTTMRDVGRFTGSLLAKSSFVVAPKTAGRLERLMVNIGDRVTRGQVIALPDDEEYSQQVKQASAELDVAEATVE